MSWLVSEKFSDHETKRGNFDADKLSRKLVLLIAFHITHWGMEDDDEDRPIEAVSLLSPLHFLCSDFAHTWASTLEVADKSCLPYQPQT